MTPTDKPSSKREPGFVLEGRQFTLTFSNVERRSTTRHAADGHDNSESEPAYIWWGKVTIRHLGHQKDAAHLIDSEVFLAELVEGLELYDIVFLRVAGPNGKLHRLSHRNAQQRQDFVDHIAQKLLAEWHFSPGNLQLQALRPDERDRLLIGTGIAEAGPGALAYAKIDPDDARLCAAAEKFSAYRNASGPDAIASARDAVTQSLLESFPCLAERREEVAGLVEAARQLDFPWLIHRINGETPVA